MHATEFLLLPQQIARCLSKSTQWYRYCCTLLWKVGAGCVFSPIAGVLIADYLLVKRMRIDLVALFEPKGSYWY